MGRDTIHFQPRQAIKQELQLLKEQNILLENSIKQQQHPELRNDGFFGMAASALNQFNISSFNPIFQSNIVAPISVNFTFLNFFYKTHGIIQTAINQPVLDALRGGLDIHSQEIDEDDVDDLQNTLEEQDIIDGVIGVAATWARLFGGGAIIVNDGGKFDQELTEDMPLRTLVFYPAARWELGSPHRLEDPTAWVSTDSPWESAASRTSEFYNYYGMRLHKSRVITICGKEAPWLVRWMLQGWGMSEIECMIEDFNLYLRTRNVLYDLLNEAKVDVFGIDGFRETLLSDGGSQKMLQRIATVQQAKNMNNALLMDKNDEYDQKQLTFTGIAEVMQENKMGIASAVRMPISKIFGVASSGFSSGEDDIENYNAKVESEVRNRIRKPIRQVIDLVMRFKWGQTYDYKLKFKPLRVMSAKDEEDIREKKFNRTLAAYDRALMDSKEVGQAWHKDTLISVDTKAAAGKLEDYPEPPMGAAGEETETGEGGSKKSSAAEGKPKKPKGE